MRVRMVLGDLHDPADPFPGPGSPAGSWEGWRTRQRGRRMALLASYELAADELLTAGRVRVGELHLSQRADQGIVLVVRPHTGRRAAAGCDAFRLAAWALTTAGELARQAAHEGAHPHNVTVTN